MDILVIQYYAFLILALILGTGVSLATVLSYLKPTSIGHKELSILLLAASGYLLFNSLEVLAVSQLMTKVFSQICYLFIAFLPVLWFLFCLRYTGFSALTGWKLVPFLIIPTLTVIFAFTNDLHHWLWTSWEFPRVGPFTTIRTQVYGPWFWINVSYSQLVATTGTLVVLRDLFRKSLAINRQTLIVVSALLLPLVVNLVYVIKLISWLRKDFSAVAYALSGILLTIGVYYDHLFDLPPIARRALIEAMDDPLIVVDSQRRVVTVNRPAAKLDESGRLTVGTTIDESPFLSGLHDRINQSGEKMVELSAKGAWYEARWSDIPTPGRLLRLYALRDITLRRRLLEEKTALIAELTTALHQIRTLEGIIPICASCKKIRDDKGYWQQVESYVASHTLAEFSHGLCPDCRRNLYPETSKT